MRTFDITFAGTALPGYDVAQVKQGVADFLAITDATVADQLFSGETVYLCCDLDRKAAAEFYQRFQAIGALVAIVSSSARHHAKTPQFIRLENGGKASPQLIHVATAATDSRGRENGVADRLWPVSRARMPAAKKPRTHGPEAGPRIPAAPPLQSDAQPTRSETPDGTALGTLQQEAQLKRERLTQEISGLERIHIRLREEAQVEIAELDHIRWSIQLELNAEIERLELMRSEVDEAAQQECARLAVLEQALLQESDIQTSQLDATFRELVRHGQQASTELEQAIAQAQQQAADEIAKLEQLLNATREASTQQVEQLARQLRSISTDTETRLGQLDAERTALHQARDQSITDLRREQAEVTHRSQREIDQIRQRKSDAGESAAAELRELDTRIQDIKSTIARGSLRVQDACAKLRSEADASLEEIRQLEQLLQQQSRAETRSDDVINGNEATKGSAGR